MIPQLSPIVNMLQKSFTNRTHYTKIIHITGVCGTPIILAAKAQKTLPKGRLQHIMIKISAKKESKIT